MRLRALRSRPKPTTPVEAAAALIELSLHESNGPVEELSGALTRIAQSLRSDGGDFQQNRELLARDMAVCVESLQFHDRLTQQLTQVRNLLASLAFSEMYLDSKGHLAGTARESARPLYLGLASGSVQPAAARSGPTHERSLTARQRRQRRAVLTSLSHGTSSVA
jgi:hypothetical protein